jgi:cytochrome c oxidase subunit 2
MTPDFGPLWSLFFWVTVAVFVIVSLAALLAAWRGNRLHRSSAEPAAFAVHDEAVPPEGHARVPIVALDAREERRLAVAVGVAAAITVVILFVLLVASFSAARAAGALRAQAAMTIDVTGEQWWWRVRYGAEAAPSQVFTTANEIHIPAGVAVRLRLTSSDVIHSLWIPGLAAKRDLIPGQDTELVIRADEPGVYRGQCAEFCGLEHAQMAFLVVADPPDAFEAWRKQQLEPAKEPMTELARRGRQIFFETPCFMCHTVRGTKAGAVTGPDLTHFASRTTIAAGTAPNNRGHLAGWILSAPSMKPGTKMPAMSLSPAELDALLAWLEELR